MKIIGIGSALVDVLVRLTSDEPLARLGLEKGSMHLIDSEEACRMADLTATLSPEKATGGSAGNTVLALALLGAKSAFVSRVGSDDNGRFYAKTFAEAGIEPRMIVVDETTGVANTFITPDSERTFATFLGASAGLSVSDITPDLFRGCDLLHIEGYLISNPALLEAICRTAKDCGMMTSIDLASYNVVKDNRTEFQRLVESYIDIVFANEEEAAAFTLQSDPQESARQIARLCQLAVVKMGAKGACVAKRGAENDLIFVPAQRVKVVDTTAAGDFFAGGFLHAFAEGCDLRTCLERGTLLASEVIQVVGTRIDATAWKKRNEKNKKC